jgi:hypothetical protein
MERIKLKVLVVLVQDKSFYLDLVDSNFGGNWIRYFPNRKNAYHFWQDENLISKIFKGTGGHYYIIGDKVPMSFHIQNDVTYKRYVKSIRKHCGGETPFTREQDLK